MKKIISVISAFFLVITTGFSQQPWVQVIPYITSGLSKPVEITHCNDRRLFIVEQDGRIRIVMNDTLKVLPFLDINPQVLSTGTEQGLLGLAFDPDYKVNGHFFVNYINNSGNTVISRFSVNPLDSNTADPQSEVVFLTVNQPYTNHNGGDIEFGPDGYLYIPLGDGGSANDPQNRAQNQKELLGKFLRIDVRHGDQYLIPPDNPHVNDTAWYPEIWSLGVRNPWKASFDRLTNHLWFGDVGQDTWEEVDFIAADEMSGRNFGWRCYEATHPFNTSGCLPVSSFTEPVYEYQHSGGGNCSITGGVVYRGARYGNLFGHYLFADFCVPEFRTLKRENDTTFSYLAHSTWSGAGISVIGEDDRGNLYAGNLYNGHVRRLVDTTSCAPAAFLSENDSIRICAPTGQLSTPYADSLTYLWYRNGTMLPVTSNVLQIAQNGFYLVRVQHIGTGCFAEDSVFVQLTPNAPTLSFSGVNSSYCVFDPAVTLSASPSGGLFSGIGVNGNQFDPAAAGVGNYLLQYTYSTSNGCVYKSQVQTAVNSCTALFENGSISGLIAFPNPAADLLNLKFSCAAAGTATLEVYNLSGRKLFSRQLLVKMGANAERMDVGTISPGTYLLLMQHDKGSTATKFIVD